MGNHGTTMFDELRGCSITIHAQHSHQFRTPLGSTSGFQGLEYFLFLCPPVFCAWTCERFEEQKQNRVFFATDQPGDKPWNDINKSWKDTKKLWKNKKVVERRKRVVDTAVKYFKTGICCVLSIDTTNV